MRPGQVGLWGFRTKLLCIIAIVLHNIYVYIHIFIYDIISRKCNIKFQTLARTPHCWGTLLMLRQHNSFPHQHKVVWSSELVLSSSSEEFQLATVYWLPPYPSGSKCLPLPPLSLQEKQNSQMPREVWHLPPWLAVSLPVVSGTGSCGSALHAM